MKEVINTPDAPAALGPYSQAKRIGSLLALSGQIAVVPGTGPGTEKEIEFDNQSPGAETHRILTNIGAVLRAAGCGYEAILKTTVFIRDPSIFAKVNEAYSEYFEAGSAPARSCVVAAPPIDGINVEIEALAVVPGEHTAVQPPSAVDNSF